jgi:hypothetical protein
LGLLLQIALSFVEESEQSSPADVIDTAVEGIAVKKRCEKKFKLKYQIFFRRNL